MRFDEIQTVCPEPVRPEPVRPEPVFPIVLSLSKEGFSRTSTSSEAERLLITPVCSIKGHPKPRQLVVANARHSAAMEALCAQISPVLACRSVTLKNLSASQSERE